MAKITMYLDSKGETVDCFVDYDPDKIFLREYVDTKNVWSRRVRRDVGLTFL